MTVDLFGTVQRDAVVSACGRYRYGLMRCWEPDKPWLGWIMLNPSTADANVDDPTIRRCIDFGRRWGFGGMIVVNLFAWRATNPTELKKVADPIGPENDSRILSLLQPVPVVQRVVCAWGKGGRLLRRDLHVYEMLSRAGADRVCLRSNDDGSPEHPLYVPAATTPVKFQMPQAAAV